MRRVLSLPVALVWLLLSAGLGVACAQVPERPTPPAFRLPDGARPTAYALSLTVVPGAPVVSGEIAIDVALERPHALVWLNADAVTVKRAGVDDAATRVEVIAGHEQFVGLAFDPPLAPGTHRLTLAFEAEQATNATRGVFTLKDGDASYTMTQFEALSARRAFPCFDEPGFKTPWQLTLRVPREAVAVSNTTVESESVGADGTKTVRFARTVPLPTYLVAFAVGPWEVVDLGRLGSRGTPTRVIVPKGRTADAAFVASAYPELFVALERWFGIAYPFDKLDHIAIPLTVGFAMENAGLITYGLPILLAKPGEASPRFRRNAANVGAHEIAHQCLQRFLPFDLACVDVALDVQDGASERARRLRRRHQRPRCDHVGNGSALARRSDRADGDGRADPPQRIDERDHVVIVGCLGISSAFGARPRESRVRHGRGNRC